ESLRVREPEQAREAEPPPLQDPARVLAPVPLAPEQALEAAASLQQPAQVPVPSAQAQAAAQAESNSDPPASQSRSASVPAPAAASDAKCPSDNPQDSAGTSPACSLATPTA